MWEAKSEDRGERYYESYIHSPVTVVIILTYCPNCHVSFDLLGFVLLLHCQSSDHWPSWCLWVSVSSQGSPCQTVVSEVKFLLDWPGMPLMTTLSPMPGSKWQIFSFWEACGWTEERRGPAGHTERKNPSRCTESLRSSMRRLLSPGLSSLPVFWLPN